MVPKLQAVKDVWKSDEGWSQIDHKASDLIIETKKAQNGINYMRAHGSVNFSAVDCYRCMGNLDKEWKRQWDENCDFTEHLQKVGVNSYVTYNKTKGMYVVSSRDFVMNFIMNEEADGTIIDCVTSEKVEFDCPEKKGTVRAFTQLTGKILKPDPANPNKCTMYSVAMFDIKGQIPGWALAGAIKDQGLQIDKLRQVMPKWKSKFPSDERPN